MKHILLGSFASLALAIGSAQAADMPTPKPVPAPAFSWAGWYVGSGTGGSWDRTQVSYTTPFTAIKRSLDPSGPVSSMVVGYNWQAGQLVYGVEADGNFLHISQSRLYLFPGTVPDTPGLPFGSVTGDNTLFKVRQESFGTLRGRLGYASSGWLYYATGGLAYGAVRYTITEALVAPDTAFFRTVDSTKTKVGWSAGAGFQVSFGGGWSAGVEYLYVDLGKSTIAQGPSFALVAFPADATTFHDTSHIVRLKLNYALGIQ